MEIAAIKTQRDYRRILEESSAFWPEQTQRSVDKCRRASSTADRFANLAKRTQRRKSQAFQCFADEPVRDAEREVPICASYAGSCPGCGAARAVAGPFQARNPQ